MKKHTFLLTLSLLLCISINSCTEDGKKKPDSSATTSPGENDNNAAAPSIQARRTAPETHQCLIAGTVLENNSYWIKTAQVLVGISADSTTKDIDFGKSHRIFTAMNTTDCSILFKEVLPVNRSPDFPWYLNTNTYESLNKVLCTQGTEYVYCYDVATKKLLPQMKPKFYNKRIAIDAQSGQPAGLAIWDRYLVGLSIDQGASVFNLINKEEPTAILPSAEFYSENNGSYHSLFLLKNENGQTQALIPRLNDDQDGMIANLLFKIPLDLNTTINASVKDNRFIILLNANGTSKTAIDMEKQIEVELPAAVINKKTKEILKWLSAR